MAAEIIFTIDTTQPASGRNQHNPAGVEAAYAAEFGNKDVVLNNHRLLIRQISDISLGSYSFANYNTGAANKIEYYGWDPSAGKPKPSVIINANQQYVTLLTNSGKHVHIHDLTLRANAIPNLYTLVTITSDGLGERIIVIGNGASPAGIAVSCGQTTGRTAKISHCLALGCDAGFAATGNYDNDLGRVFENCVAVKNAKGFELSALQNPSRVVLQNCISFGNTTNWTGSAYTNNRFVARNNASASGVTPPDSVGGKSIVMTAADFVDYDGNDYHITETSKLRHTHIDYPTGNNILGLATQDIDGDPLPSTYTTDSDRWDTGYDYWTPVITGTTWRIDEAEFVGGVATLSDATVLKDVDEAEADTTLGKISPRQFNVTLDAVVDGNTLTVDETTFEAVDSDPTGNEFLVGSDDEETAENLAAKINAMSGISATNDGETVIITKDAGPLDFAVTGTASRFSVVKFDDRDTLKLCNGRTAILNYTNLRGFDVDITDGLFRIESDGATPVQHWGWTTKNIKVGALGKVKITSPLAEVGTVGAINWPGLWGTTKDALGNYAEPGVLFVGASAETAVPYYNLGAASNTVANDATHGRTFTFAPTTAAIAFPDHQPTAGHKVYCWSVMLHSKDGQSTAARSYGFDTLTGGAVEIDGCLTTGAADFQEATELKLHNFGIIQPLTLKHCSGVSLKAYRGFSTANPNGDGNSFDDLTGSLGELYSLAVSTGLTVRSCRSWTLSKLWLEMFADNYAALIGGPNAGNDNGLIEEAVLLGGGIRIQFGQAIGLTINKIAHSNDISGTNTRTTQNVFFVDTIGARNVAVKEIALAANGLPTQQNIVALQNTGNWSVSNINYPATVKAALFCGGSTFDGLLSTVLCEKFTQQAVILDPGARNIRAQNIRATALPSPLPTFDEYNGCENISMKNVAVQSDGGYKGWLAVVPDLNFQELNKFGTPYTGVLALHFYRSSKGIYTLTGTAKSNQLNAVLLPAVGDSVTVRWPYAIKVGAATGYFANVTPEIIGTNTGNYAVEYRLSVNGGAWGSWAALTAGNLSGSTFTAGDEVQIEVRATCTTAAADNAVRRVIVHTLPDAGVQYPATLYTLTLRNIVDGSAYYVENTATSQVIAQGTHTTGDLVIPDIAYAGGSASIRIRVRRGTTAPLYKPYVTFYTENGADQTVYISQVLDE